MRRRLFWIIVGLIILGIAISCLVVLDNSEEAKEKPVVVALEEEYEKIPIKLVQDRGFYFVVLPEEPFFLEFRFGEKERDWFCFSYDEEIFEIKEAENSGVKFKISRRVGSWVHLRRKKPEGWTKLLVASRLYRGKLDPNGLTIGNDYDRQGLGDFLKEEKRLEVNSREVKEAAAEIRQSLKSSQRDNPYFLIKATLAWLDNNLTYSLVPKYLVDAFAEVVKKMPQEERSDPHSLFFELRKLIPRVFPIQYRDKEITDENLKSWTKTYHTLYGKKKDLPVNDPEELSFMFLNRLAEFSPFIASASWSGRISARQTLKDRVVKCSGVSCAFVAICRSFGIPAKKVGGCVVTGSYVEGWHGWAIVYLTGYGWVEVDPTFGEFDNFSYDRHAYSIFAILDEDNVKVSAYKFVNKNIKNKDVP